MAYALTARRTAMHVRMLLRCDQACNQESIHDTHSAPQKRAVDPTYVWYLYPRVIRVTDSITNTLRYIQNLEDQLAKAQEALRQVSLPPIFYANETL